VSLVRSGKDRRLAAAPRTAGGAACLPAFVSYPLFVLLLVSPSARAESVNIAASKDNTIFSEDGNFSNGAGQHLFAGRTGGTNTRRALIAFDVARSVPAGSTITAAKLTLSMSKTLVREHPVGLHVVLADWGEGGSDATLNEGMGAPATPGDATWLFRFFDSLRWSAPGGDFVPTASATIPVDLVGFYTWGSTPDMVADVQEWLDSPEKSFGWILRGNEAVFPTSKRFDSSQNLDVGVRPVLSVEFTSPVDLAGRVPDGHGVPGAPLTIARDAAGQLTLRWGPSCLSTDTDFEVYEGVLRQFTGHRPRACSTAGATAFTLPSPQGNVYYLVVPRNVSREGSYGASSSNLPRPASLEACLPQAVTVCQ
jgi:hypothetical protein